MHQGKTNIGGTWIGLARHIAGDIAAGKHLEATLAPKSCGGRFAITDIEERTRIDTDETKTTIFQGMNLQIINREMAIRLNDELDTNVFSASVVLGDGSLVVTRAR